MKNGRLKLTSLVVMVALGMSACMNEDLFSTSGSQAKTDYLSAGVITGFGSVYINGVEFETDDTQFNIDDAEGAESQLKIGMYITLEGNINEDGLTGQAASIIFENEVEGIVLAKDINAGVGTMDVMGQTVVIDLDTKFESDIAEIRVIDDVELDQMVEVSGYASGIGKIYATRVELKRAEYTEGEEIELKGIVSALNDSTFVIGLMTIDYTSAQFEDFDTMVLANGMYVEVKSTEGINVDNQLVASKIELESDKGKGEKREDGKEMEIEGVVTASVATDRTSVEINGQTVVLNMNTEYEYGSIDGVIVGAKVEVEGEFDSDDRFVADKIKFRQKAEIKMEGFIESVDSDAGTVLVFGQTIKVNNLTFMEDDKNEHDVESIKYFNLDHIAVGDFVEIKAYLESNGEMLAAKFKREDAEDDGQVKLEGNIDSVSENGQLTVAGITVDVSALNSSSQFVEGVKVEIKGFFSDGVFSASKISLED